MEQTNQLKAWLECLHKKIHIEICNSLRWASRLSLDEINALGRAKGRNHE